MIAPEIQLYGISKYMEGFGAGYKKNTFTRRRRTILKEKSRMNRFNEFIDYLDDIIWEARKK